MALRTPKKFLAKSELAFSQRAKSRVHRRPQRGYGRPFRFPQPGGAMAAAQSSSFRAMEASSLTRQANQVWARIKQDIPSEYRSELQNIVQELSARVDFVSSGKAPRSKTNYQSLQAAPLAQQARGVVAEIARNVPLERRDDLGVIDALADRVEFAAVGSSSFAARSSSSSSSSRSRSTSARSRSSSSRSRASSSSSRKRSSSSSRSRSAASRSSSQSRSSSPSSSSMSRPSSSQFGSQSSPPRP
jgi:hypothetical protein